MECYQLSRQVQQLTISIHLLLHTTNPENVSSLKVWEFFTELLGFSFSLYSSFILISYLTLDCIYSLESI